MESKKNKSFDIGIIYREISNGFSERKINKTVVYFKHPTMGEHFRIYSRYSELLKEAELKGLLSEKQKIEEAISENWWHKDKEKEIYVLREGIKNLKKTKLKLFFPHQKNEIEKQIKSREAILLTLVRERQSIINYTAEEYVNNKFMDEMIIYFTYKNSDLKNQLFSTINDYYNSSDDFIEKVKSIYSIYSEDLNEKNIKLVAASGFFQNMIYLGDECYTFWGKPVVQCSKFQNDLLLYGKMFKNIIKNNMEGGNSLSDEILNDPELFLEWTENGGVNKKTIASKNKNSGGKNTVSSYVGATAQDLESIGVKVEKFRGKSLLDIANEKGGVLEKNDYLNLRENI